MTQPQKQNADRRKETAPAARKPGPVTTGPEAILEEPDLLALQHALADPAMATATDTLALQRRYGNRAVQRLVAQRHTPEEEKGFQLRATQQQSPEVGQSLEVPGPEQAKTETTTVAKTGSTTGFQTAPEAMLQRKCRSQRRHRTPVTPGNCHEWVLMQKGMDQGAVRWLRSRSPTDPGASLNNGWYGTHIIRSNTHRVNRFSVLNWPVGTVLVVDTPGNPAHSMVIREQRDTETLIQGFNNTGTFGPDAPFLELDPVLRSLHHSAPRFLAASGLPTQWDGNMFRTVGGPCEMNAVSDADYRRNMQEELAGRGRLAALLGRLF